MKPAPKYLMTVKCPAAASKAGLVLPDGVESSQEKTGFEVKAVGQGVEYYKPGDIVFPGYVESAREANGYVFFQASDVYATK